MTHSIELARAGNESAQLLLEKANRHGLITGATGTGKTITLQTLAEGFSKEGVPVFMADIKGDLTGISQAAVHSEKLKKIIAERALPLPTPTAYPVTLWDVFGKQGHPVRATISDMGPILLARMLNLNETQTGVLQLVFKIADDGGLLLLDMKDLRAVCQAVGDHAGQYTTSYGNISPASIGAIQRSLLQLEEQGGEQFFGEPMLNIQDFLQTDTQGRGVINILAADQLLNAPRLYAAFLLWLLSELFELLPEVGDVSKPKIVFFFDEAHLLFTDAPGVLLERIELLVRLIRSKGVGVYFVTQNPLDVPDSVSAQLGNRVHHALRAYTPREQKAVAAAAQTMRPNPAIDITQAMTELAVGEALISLQDEKGRPSVTQRLFVHPPAGQIGPISEQQRDTLRSQSLVAGVYEKSLDRESAFELLKNRSQSAEDSQNTGEKMRGSAGAIAARENGETHSQEDGGLGQKAGAMLKEALFGRTGPRGGQYDGLVQQVAKSIIRQEASKLGRSLLRGVLGGIMGKR